MSTANFQTQFYNTLSTHYTDVNSITCSSISGTWAGWSGDRIPVGSKIFRIHPDWPWGPPSLLYNGCWVSFMKVK